MMRGRNCCIPTIWHEAEKDVQRALETGRYFSEFRVIWADGSIHWLEARRTSSRTSTTSPCGSWA